MDIQKNKSLKEYNTFGIDCKARYFTSVKTIDQLKMVLKNEDHQARFVLGGGSNILFTKDINELVIHIGLKGITIIDENHEFVTIEVMAGENWHEFVLFCIDNDYGGIENLSLIPGNVGAAPIQNIGAYGVELKDVFESCKALSIETLSERIFSNEDCRFDYRNSIFKSEEKGNYIITSVTFRLTKKDHKKNIAYGAIKQMLEKKNILNPTLKDISDTVIQIRCSKLPDPKEMGNSGSFFKNPVLNAYDFNQFIDQNPEAPYYQLPDSYFKIPAGWLIEKAGFKGKKYGNAGVHKDQALVLVNYGNANGDEIRDLAYLIQGEIKKIFGIIIEPEVNII